MKVGPTDIPADGDALAGVRRAAGPSGAGGPGAAPAMDGFGVRFGTLLASHLAPPKPISGAARGMAGRSVIDAALAARGDEATGEAREAEIGFASAAPTPRERPAQTDEDRDESGTNEPSARPTEPERSKRDAAALPDDPSAPAASTSEPEQATEDATQESTVQRPEDASRAAPAVARRAAAYSADVATQRATAETQIRLVV